MAAVPAVPAKKNLAGYPLLFLKRLQGLLRRQNFVSSSLFRPPTSAVPAFVVERVGAQKNR